MLLSRSIISFSVTWLFITSNGISHWKWPLWVLNSSLVFVFFVSFRFIIVKCSLKCNFFFGVNLCGMNEMESSAQNHKSFFRRFYGLSHKCDKGARPSNSDRDLFRVHQSISFHTLPYPLSEHDKFPSCCLFVLFNIAGAKIIKTHFT